MACGLVAAALMLAGCGSGQAGTSTSAAGQPVAATSQAGGPPEEASMVCTEDEIKSRIKANLDLADDPPSDSHWGDSLFSCIYHLPGGPLGVSVKVLGSAQEASAYLQAQRAGLPGAQETGGFGEQAYETDGGVIVARKDAFVLRVDATHLPDTLGVAPTQESRLDLAAVVASGVFDCWTEGSG